MAQSSQHKISVAHAQDASARATKSSEAEAPSGKICTSSCAPGHQPESARGRGGPRPERHARYPEPVSANRRAAQQAATAPQPAQRASRLPGRVLRDRPRRRVVRAPPARDPGRVAHKCGASRRSVAHRHRRVGIGGRPRCDCPVGRVAHRRVAHHDRLCSGRD